MRLAEPLEAGAQYQSHVKMIPSREDQGVFLGDVYVLRNTCIVGLVHGTQFRRYPKLLLGRFFSPSDSTVLKPCAAVQVPHKPTSLEQSGCFPTTVLGTSDAKTTRHVPTEGSSEEITGPRKSSQTVSTMASVDGSQSTQSETQATDQNSSTAFQAEGDPESITPKATALIASQIGIGGKFQSELGITLSNRLSHVGMDFIVGCFLKFHVRSSCYCYVKILVQRQNPECQTK